MTLRFTSHQNRPWLNFAVRRAEQSLGWNGQALPTSAAQYMSCRMEGHLASNLGCRTIRSETHVCFSQPVSDLHSNCSSTTLGIGDHKLEFRFEIVL